MASLTDNQKLVEPLLIIIEEGRPIANSLVPGFVCVCSKRIPEARIIRTGVHQDSCLWNYFVYCRECPYQNNLAKCIPNYECGCRR